MTRRVPTWRSHADSRQAAAQQAKLHTSASDVFLPDRAHRSLQVQDTAAARLAKPAEDLYVPIPGYRHQLLVLTSSAAGGSPDWDAAALEKAASEVVWPLGITWYRGSEAATLGAHLQHSCGLPSGPQTAPGHLRLSCC